MRVASFVQLPTGFFSSLESRQNVHTLMAFGDENTEWKPATASFGGIAVAQYKLGIPSCPRHDGFRGSTEKTSQNEGSQQRLAGRVWVVGKC